MTARRVDGVKGDGWRKARRTQASNSSPGQDGTAGSTRSRLRLIIDGTSARWTWRAPPCARALIRGRAGPASLKLRVDGVQGAERVRDTVAAMACGVPRECTHRSVLVASLDVRGCYAALAAHASQLVWFRRLFVVFSAYTYANRLVVIE